MTKVAARFFILTITLASFGFCQAAKNDPADPNEDLTTEPDMHITALKEDISRQFEQILTTYVDDKGNVDYQSLRRKRADLIKITRKIDELHPAEMMSWSWEEQIAFWINTHNIFTLKLIIDNYPIQPRWYLINYPDSSLMQIPGGRTKKYFKVMGMEYNLREIEREILLGRFKDPRVCFALSYASEGGAFLLNESYRADKLDIQLKKQIKRFLADTRGIRIDHAKKVFTLSDIFSWYEEDFIEKYGQIKRFRDRKPDIQAYLNFIIDYIPSETAKLFKSKDYPVRFHTYNWRLNEQTSK